MIVLPEVKDNAKTKANLLDLCVAVAAASPFPMVGLEGPTHVIRFANAAFCALTHNCEDQLTGCAFSAVEHAGEAFLSLLDRVYQTKQAESHSGQEQVPSNSRYWSYAAWPVPASIVSEPRMILLQVIDQTPLFQDAIATNEALTLSLIRQHELTEAAELANAQLKSQIVARTKAEEALIVSEKLSSVGRMAAVISHEINNPLAAVTDLIYLAQTSNGTSDEVLEYLKTADGELKRIAHITQQTLGLYREMSSPTTFRVVSLLDSVLDLLQAKLKSKFARVKKQCDDQLQIGSAIYGELRQVLSNLLANSLDALEQNGSITLKASSSSNPENGESRVRITIADNGCGIGTSTLSRIFEPFFTTKGALGNGLGLWVSKQLVENHGGAIQVRSSTKGPRRGTSFSVVLPNGNVK